MSDIPAANVSNIQEEEVQFSAAVSEYFGRRAGQLLNFIKQYHVFDHTFKMNFSIGAMSGRTGIDGFFVFPYDVEIIDAVIYKESPGSSGQMQLDVLLAPFGSSTFTSIFSTTPIITAAAGSNIACGTGDSVSGVTSPVLTSNPILVTAKTKMRMDCLSMDAGFPANGGISIKYRPR